VGFEGDKLTVISEFAVKTVLENLKLLKKAILLMMRLLAIDLEYTLLYHSKHTMYISYVAENSQTKNSTRRYNNIQYCTSKMDV
jgi:hypothetical protein